MGFNPLQEKGMPIEKQFTGWPRLNSKPYHKESVEPYTRARSILMNGIESEAAIFTHHFCRHTGDMDLRRRLTLVRRAEQEQQKAVNWTIPADESHLETTIGYEQVAVDLTAFLARTEPDSYVKAALDFALLEDFDHLYRYANLLKLDEGKEASAVTRQYTEITMGRPTYLEHRHPFDDVRRPIHGWSADPLTKLHILTITAAEQQTMNFYMNVGNRHGNSQGRGLYLEIAQVEEAHVSHYESLMDPNASWLERWLLREYNECWLYHSLLQQETDGQVRSVWQRHLEMEIEHLRLAADAVRQHERRDPEAVLPREMPQPLRFESNIDYVRDILRSQHDFNAVGEEFVPAHRVPRDYRFHDYQRMVNSEGIPSETVIRSIIERQGRDYRQELRGEHPVEQFRQRILTHA